VTRFRIRFGGPFPEAGRKSASERERDGERESARVRQRDRQTDRDTWLKTDRERRPVLEGDGHVPQRLLLRLRAKREQRERVLSAKARIWPCLSYMCHICWTWDVVFFFFFTLVTGPKRSLSLKLSDTRAYARHGIWSSCPRSRWERPTPSPPALGYSV